MSENFEQQKKDSIQMVCPGCGANLTYSAEKGNLFCQHCEGVFSIQKDTAVRERDFSELSEYTRWTEDDVNYFVCKNCGAHSVASKTLLSTRCCFCDSALVIEQNELSTVKPDTVIPFEVSGEQAKNAILLWRKKRFFAPRTYKKYLDVDTVKGVYSPIWTFDSETCTAYRGRLGKRKTRTVRRNGKTRLESYTVWFNVSGTVRKSFDDIMIRGNSHVPQNHFEDLQPFPQNKYVVYNDQYLAGFSADNYTVEPEAAFKLAVAKMRDEIRQQIKNNYNADVVGELSLDIEFESKSFKYLFVPIYITATRFHEKTYNNFVSGVRAGKNKSIKVSGTAPTSAVKVMLLALLVLALIFGIAFGGTAIGIFESPLDILDVFDFFFGSTTEIIKPPTFASNLCFLGSCLKCG